MKKKRGLEEIDGEDQEERTIMVERYTVRALGRIVEIRRRMEGG